MKKLIAVTSAAVLFGGLSVPAFAANTNATSSTSQATKQVTQPATHTAKPVTQQSTPTVTQSQEVKFNFLLKANIGKIKTGKESGTYVIAVPINNIHSILQYSEKPNKVSKYITAKELLTIWQQSFVTVHPNGSISSNKMQPIAVTFTNVKIKGNNAYFKFTPIHKNTKINTSTPLMVPHIFIDSYNGSVH